MPRKKVQQRARVCCSNRRDKDAKNWEEIGKYKEGKREQMRKLLIFVKGVIKSKKTTGRNEKEGTKIQVPYRPNLTAAINIRFGVIFLHPMYWRTGIKNKDRRKKNFLMDIRPAKSKKKEKR